MIVFAFFTAVFSSVSWIIYAILYIRSKLEDTSLWEQAPDVLLTYAAIFVLPLLVIWVIFGYVNQFGINRAMNKKQTALLTQLQKNQDYTDLVVRVMLDAEHEIKDGFVINKFDVLIGDMNEALAEIIQRCNIASSAQLDALWQRVKRGEKWSLGKAILEASKSQSTFDAWVREKVNRDKVFRGALLEFCSRYQNLLQLLEKHDRDRIFLHMIETGVFGKVYSIIAPMTEGIKINQDERVTVSASNENDYAAVLKLATMKEPSAQNTIMNVDRNDEDESEDYDYEKKERKSSIFARLNPFNRVSNDDIHDEESEEQDPFFKALHNSFQDEYTPSFSNENSSVLSVTSDDDAAEKNNPSFGSDTFTSDSFFHRTTSLSDEINASKIKTDDTDDERDYKSDLSFLRTSAFEEKQSNGISLASSLEKVKEVSNNEDLVYPFGGWTDEDKYNK